MSGKKDDILKCSFCGKTQDQVTRLIAGPGVYICDQCVELCSEIMEDEMTQKAEQVDNDTEINLLKPKEIKDFLDEYVVGQDDAKRALSVAVYNHYKRVLSAKDMDVEIQKSNIIMVGPTGSGKTFLAQTLAKILNVPFAIADATALTEAGYVGEDVETMLRTLLQNADYDIESAQRGIVYIDEIDKISRKGENMSITRDVSGEGVQQALLKIIEGTISEVPVTDSRKHPHGETVKIDTSNILFICGGAFDGIDKLIGKKETHSSIGFGANVVNNQRTIADLSMVEQHDFVKYGLVPELIGRLPIITVLNPLSENDLVRILTEPKNAITKQYRELLSMDGVKLEFEDEALRKIAELAIKKKTGARGLRSIIESAMQKIMFDIPNMSGAKKVVVTTDCVEGKADALVYGARNKKIA